MYPPFSEPARSGGAARGAYSGGTGSLPRSISERSDEGILNCLRDDKIACVPPVFDYVSVLCSHCFGLC